MNLRGLAGRTIQNPDFAIYVMLLVVLAAQLVLLHQIRDCTDPNGSCARRGQQATAAAVGSINEITIDAAYCANVLPPPVSSDAVRKCVFAQLAKR